MANLNYHPAPGLGDLLPGFFVVPQNPITSVNSGVTYVPGIGDVLPGSFVVPQNPIKSYTSGKVVPIGTSPGISGCGGGCGCSGDCGHSGQLNGVRTSGVSGISEDWSKIQSDISGGNYMAILQDTVFGVPVWAGVAAVVAMFFIGGEKHSYAGRSRRAYRAASSAF